MNAWLRPENRCRDGAETSRLARAEPTGLRSEAFAEDLTELLAGSVASAGSEMSRHRLATTTGLLSLALVMLAWRQNR
jgi:hypothetical protein